LGHAFLFTFIDRGDAGGSRPAFANFAGSLAAGFVGNAYMPAGYNDATHAGQRSLMRLGIYGGTNILREFTPELVELGRKFNVHLGRKFNVHKGGVPIPVWWVSDKSTP